MKEPFRYRRGRFLAANGGFRAATAMVEPFHRFRGRFLAANGVFRATTAMVEPFHRFRGIADVILDVIAGVIRNLHFPRHCGRDPQSIWMLNRSRGGVRDDVVQQDEEILGQARNDIHVY